jgi:hypothetical protein
MTDTHVHVHLHIEPPEILQRLQRIEEKQDALLAQGVVEMQELDTLKAKVAETTTVEQSAIELLNGLSARIAELKNDPAQIQALADSLSAKSAELASAVAANTPGGKPCWTLVIVLRTVRRWGFWHVGKFVPWREYVSSDTATKMKSCP